MQESEDALRETKQLTNPFVFLEFLGTRDRFGIRNRPVGHALNNEDPLEFADHVFFGKPLSEESGKLPYPEESNGFDRDAPK